MSTAYPGRVLAASLAGVVLLAGCGSDGGRSADASAPTGTGGAAGGAAEREGSAADRAPAAERVEVAPADLANFGCSRRDDGRWRAEGIVTNSAGRPMVYTVTVVAVDDRERVVGERIESFRLKPEEARPFSWPRFYRGAASVCMPRVERAPV